MKLPSELPNDRNHSSVESAVRVQGSSDVHEVVDVVVVAVGDVDIRYVVAMQGIRKYATCP